jgi:uncharacterized protein
MHIPDAALGQVCDILRRQVPPGVEVFAYGSRAHGRNLKTFSDLDLCLRGSASVPWEVVARLRIAFEDSDLPFRVDVVDWARLKRDFREAISGDFARIFESQGVVRAPGE